MELLFAHSLRMTKTIDKIVQVRKFSKLVSEGVPMVVTTDGGVNTLTLWLPPSRGIKYHHFMTAVFL